MTAATYSEPTTSSRARASWALPLVIGILLVIGGALALGLAVLTSLVSVIFLGAVLLVTGVLEIISGFSKRRSAPFFHHFLLGVLTAVVGGLFLWRPLAGLGAVTLLFAGLLFAAGLVRGISTLADRHPRWGWDLFYALVEVALGIYIVAAWPLSSLWVLGVLVGIEILTAGIALIVASLGLRELEHGRLRPLATFAPAL